MSTYTTRRPDSAYYRRVQWIATLVPAVSLGGFEFIRHGLFDRVLPPDVGNVVAACLVAAWGWLYVRSLIRLIEQTNSDLWREQEQAAVLRERDRIARNMHDGVCQALFYMNVTVSDIRSATADLERPELAATLAQLQDAVSATYHQVRATIADLRLRAAAQDLRQLVEGEARRLAEQAGWQLEVDLPDSPLVVEPAVQAHVLGVLAEALTNARKHAGAGRVSVSLQSGADGQELSVADDGRGLLPPDGSLHFGLAMMRERANALGGTLELDSAPGAGTRVTLRWPTEGRASNG